MTKTAWNIRSLVEMLTTEGQRKTSVLLSLYHARTAR